MTKTITHGSPKSFKDKKNKKRRICIHLQEALISLQKESIQRHQKQIKNSKFLKNQKVQNLPPTQTI